MPIVDSTYKPSIIFRNGFFSTVYSGLIRKIKHNPSKHKRERFTLSDGDFLDIDWDFANSASEKLLILLHGLEGSSDRPYMLGASTLFNKNGYDTLRISFRGCSGEENLKYRSYHSGDTSDLNEIIQHIIKNKPYKHIFLKGFSLGGNVILKYLGENERLPLQIKGAVAISVPCDLKGSAQRLLEFYNKPYAIRFKRHLLKRLRIKQQQFPEAIGIEELNKIKTLIDFDDIYTAKAHGFTDADDYYKQSSCRQYLHRISVPTLIINSLNDSFLSSGCYPVKEAKENPNLYLEMPEFGGHVGFYQKGPYYYNEQRSLEFIKDMDEKAAKE